ncbi:flagellar export protein FliJ [Cryobacterium sp. Hh11]|uniref:flagellar FliJ family protein n=1 Tax=Cryobacterium sp. Hh11 TaxID=2555868 RepID=UPI00106A832D|nr:flagellar FliJ family protein [Cryobacterium sp. Hh11]TFD51410.1 flagellar export protein FliJ [Cryobacterium sp. Hh11]
MQRLFPLAGLLRLRHLEQDRAAGELAEAHHRSRLLEDRRARTREQLHGSLGNPTNVRGLNALAAARASSRSMLADLDALGRTHATALASAQAAFATARAASIALEKLEVRHTEAVRAEDLRDEQAVLDEISATRWHRDRTESETEGRDA